MNRWTLPLTALVGALIGAGIAVGVMVWEPWDSSQSSEPEMRLTGAEAALHRTALKWRLELP